MNKAVLIRPEITKSGGATPVIVQLSWSFLDPNEKIVCEVCLYRSFLELTVMVVHSNKNSD